MAEAGQPSERRSPEERVKNRVSGSVRLQVDDRIADDLPGTVIRDVAAASRLVDFDTSTREHLVRRENVRASTVSPNAEGQDVGMFDEEQHVADAARAAILDERSLERERFTVRHEPKPSHLDRASGLPCLSHPRLS